MRPGDSTDAPREQQRLEQRLRARVSELRVLNRVAGLLQDLQAPLAEVLFEFVTLVPSAWQHADVAAARLAYDGRAVASPNYQQSPWTTTGEFVTCDGKSGRLEVCYLEPRPDADDGPFLLEELALVNSLAELVGTHLERRRVAAELLEEAKVAEVARVLGGIGHDIKNMLMPIQTGIELLESDLKDHFDALPPDIANKTGSSQEIVREVVGMVRNNSRRIQERVREIADAVKGRTSPPQFKPCELKTVVGDVVDSLRLYATEKGVRLAAEGVDSLPPIETDERRLFNGLYNLVNNAIPEVPKGGSVTVRGAAEGDWVELAVSDTGRGMPPEVRDSLFTPRAVSSKAGGTGLGTRIVKDVVDVHGGTIRVESEVGRGTTFTLRLPVRQARRQGKR